ncbi:hypothetical protein CLAFUW4_00603 [Fulvia fulva]|nr:hypothetical protein CLAFUR4_00604 [Fulvia fulva]WPV08584.1 hypothetical protein CLAFUW4_00603 [Fulvia fulva]WPV23326.1 hypothetical protein CLAFUW7_00608 [Fulvia fulva]
MRVPREQLSLHFRKPVNRPGFKSMSLEEEWFPDRLDSLSPMSSPSHQGDKDQNPRAKSPYHTPRAPSKETQRITIPKFVSFANTSELLCHLSTKIIEIMNERDYQNPFLNCLSADILCGTSNSGRTKVIAAHRKMVDHMPDYRNEIQHATCTVNDDSGCATVVMTMKVTGFKFDTLRQSIANFSWTRDGDRWACAAYGVLRGIEEFD